MTNARLRAEERRSSTIGAARKGAIYGIIVSFSLAALVGIIALLSGEFGETQGRIILTTLLMGATSITALCHLAIADRAMRMVGFVGLAASGVALITGLVLIWRNWNDPGFEDWFKVFATAGVLAVSFAHANLVLLLAGRRRRVIRVGVLVTLAMIAAVAIMIILPIVSEGEIPGIGNEEWYWRLFGVVGILDVLGTVVVPVLAIFVKDAPAVAVVDGADAAAPAGATPDQLVLSLPADLATALERRAAADGVDAAAAAVAALRRGLEPGQ
ncbi:hypothetical protein [Microcella frigidaquae]|uniref:Uncharacterized protein n=1 Tax=Microcella frigidaquae TaxID=424758 RepID=A0A840XF35_9MICO|nr:hypothetical protein [Microcella frigidaquae]MBB5617112.1 hypothetical protein [Microcella frigidaquae]NHN45315.1 hypothetical protein [Microcella frigidaquae]